MKERKSYSIKKIITRQHKLHLTKQPLFFFDSLSLSLVSSMQRQSLGSPVSKLHGHGGGAQDSTLISDDLNHKDDHYDDEDHKATKPHRMSLSLSLSPPPKPEKFVHVIPILTLLCFFILYLFSHSPSQSGTLYQRPPLLLPFSFIKSSPSIFFFCLFVSDLAQFNGFRRPSEHLGIM